MLNWHFNKIFGQCVRRVYTDKCLKKNNHYDALGVSPKATQADIKSAYYKLSMVYHPDKSSNDQDAKRFRDISEAYEVLGNVKLRRLYDKGLYMGSPKSYPETSNSFYKSREQRSKPPPPTGKTPIYDFDEWSRMHYGRTFARDMQNKQRRSTEQNSRRDLVNDKKQEKVLVVVTAFLVLFIYLFNSAPDYDKVDNLSSFNLIQRPRMKNKNED